MDTEHSALRFHLTVVKLPPATLMVRSPCTAWDRRRHGQGNASSCRMGMPTESSIATIRTCCGAMIEKIIAEPFGMPRLASAGDEPVFDRDVGDAVASRNGDQLYVCDSANRCGWLLDPRDSGRMLRTAITRGHALPAFSFDGRLVAGFDDDSRCMWLMPNQARRCEFSGTWTYLRQGARRCASAATRRAWQLLARPAACCLTCELASPATSGRERSLPALHRTIVSC